MKAEATWDSTVHECPQLSRGAAPDQRVYLIVRTVVQLSHPAEMQLVLRKRICVNLTGRPVRHSLLYMTYNIIRTPEKSSHTFLPLIKLNIQLCHMFLVLRNPIHLNKLIVFHIYLCIFVFV